MKLAGSFIRGILLLVLAGVFLLAGFAKIGAADAFAADIYAFHILSWEASTLLAQTLPWIEVGVAILILIPQFRLFGLVLVVGMLGAFTAAMATARLRGHEFSCGCFGAGSGTLEEAMLRNAVLGVLAILLFIHGALRSRFRPASERAPGE